MHSDCQKYNFAWGKSLEAGIFLDIPRTSGYLYFFSDFYDDLSRRNFGDWFDARFDTSWLHMATNDRRSVCRFSWSFSLFLPVSSFCVDHTSRRIRGSGTWYRKLRDFDHSENNPVRNNNASAFYNLVNRVEKCEQVHALAASCVILFFFSLPETFACLITFLSRYRENIILQTNVSLLLFPRNKETFVVARKITRLLGRAVIFDFQLSFNWMLWGAQTI